MTNSVEFPNWLEFGQSRQVCLDLLSTLWNLRFQVDQEVDWPISQLAAVAEAGILRWGIPDEFGGIAVSGEDQFLGWIDLASSCLTTAFILSQHFAAVSRIVQSPNQDLRAEKLPAYAMGQRFASVGLSQLSTSRQHLQKPAVTVTQEADRYLLSGQIPWVTGAGQVSDLILGGVDAEHGQSIFCISWPQPELSLVPPTPLMALNASHTTSLVADRLPVTASQLVLGPVPNALQVGASGGTGSLTTTALTLGATWASLRALRQEARKRPELQESTTRLTKDWELLVRHALQAISGSEAPDSQPTSLRLRANSLVTRTAQAYFSASKGAGFAQNHPASLALRESLFFQVWSCPQTVVQATLQELSQGAFVCGG